MLRTIVVTLIALLSVSPALHGIHAARILSLMNVASPSHHVFNRVLPRALAERGHQVTVISPNEDKPPLPANLTYIKLEGVYESLYQAFDYESFSAETPFSIIFTLNEWVRGVCEIEFQSEGAKKLMNHPPTEKFDLILTEAGWGECFYGFIPHLGSPPVVAISPFGLPTWTSGFMGTPENPSYIPNFVLPFTSRMSFMQRVTNFIIHNIMIYVYEYDHIPRLEAIARKYLSHNVSFWDVERNFTIFLSNIVPGLEDARPLSPNVIPIGGMHIKDEPDPLPEDLKKFLDEAKEGFIFFSMGSFLRGDIMPAKKIQAFLQAFSELSQRVVWKFESDLPGKPPNVMTGKWLPQSDILAHPNIKLFISHCGKMSITEAAYRGVPVVGIPFFVDQILNINKLTSKGGAVELDYKTLSKENILTAVREVLNNDSYRVNMKKMSAVFRDQPETPLERAIFWIEFVLRHGGAPHLRPVSADMSLFKYLLLDVLLFLATIALLMLLTICFIIRTVCRKLKGKSKIKQKVN